MITSDPTYPLFPFCAFLGFVLVLVPLPWHLQAWNAGTCLYMVWTALACLNQFINSIVWHGNALNPSPVWCDISSRFIVGIAVAIPAASLCINRRLYKIASANTLSVSRGMKRRAVIEDLLIGLGIPIIEMALHYIVSGHRFDIYGDIGCYPVTVNVWLNYPLVACWPIVIGLISAVYAVLSLRAFSARQSQFREFLSSNSSLTVNRYFRLMALATIELLCTLPLSIYICVLNISAGLDPYTGWADLHFNYSHVNQIPAVLWHLDHSLSVALELARWLVVACALVFFCFFGFAEEARRHYRAAFIAVSSRLPSPLMPRLPWSKEKPDMLPRVAPKELKLSGSTGHLPVFVSINTHIERVASFDTARDADKVSQMTSLSPTWTTPVKEHYPEGYGHAY